MIRRLIRELRRGTTVRSMAAEFGPTFATRHPELVARFSDSELVAYADQIRARQSTSGLAELAPAAPRGSYSSSVGSMGIR